MAKDTGMLAAVFPHGLSALWGHSEIVATRSEVRVLIQSPDVC